MTLNENPESISSLADLDQYVGGRVSVNQIFRDDNRLFVDRSSLPRIEGVLRKSGEYFFVEPDEKDGKSAYIYNAEDLEARDLKLVD